MRFSTEEHTLSGNMVCVIDETKARQKAIPERTVVLSYTPKSLILQHGNTRIEFLCSCDNNVLLWTARLDEPSMFGIHTSTTEMQLRSASKLVIGIQLAYGSDAAIAEGWKQKNRLHGQIMSKQYVGTYLFSHDGLYFYYIVSNIKELHSLPTDGECGKVLTNNLLFVSA